MTSKRYGKFAEKIMKKHGWQEGSGIGSKNQGISEPIKPQLKFDTSGVGHDPAKEFTHHWWDMAFNKAAKRIKVDTSAETDEIVVKSEKKLSKKEKRKEQKQQKKQLYAQFVKTSTLSNGQESSIQSDTKPDTDNEEEEEEEETFNTGIFHMSDEALLKACGGMTAHKGARHGHKMSAKQARLEAMDRKLLAKVKNEVPESHSLEKKKKKKRKLDE